MSAIAELHERVLERIQTVRPSMECGLTPGCEGQMQPRHSVIGDNAGAAAEPYKVDEQLKCSSCLSTQKHGIGITSDEFEAELAVRERVVEESDEASNPRIVNFATHWPNDDDRDEHLAALGYLEA